VGEGGSGRRGVGVGERTGLEQETIRNTARETKIILFIVPPDY